jgi:iron complex transport system permease protein
MSYLTKRKWFLVNGALLLALLAAMAICAAVGAERVNFARLWQASALDNPEAVIFFRIRLPRVLLAALVGGALGVAGVALQALLHNPLACPHLLGVSGGASLCGILALVTTSIVAAHTPGFLKISLVSLAAFGGAMGTTLLIYHLALVHGRLQPYALLLTGVVFNAFCSAIIMLINSLVDFYQSHAILFWLMGSLAAHDYLTVGVTSVYVGVAAAWLIGQGRRLNLLSLGEESALQLGIDV